MGDLASCGSWGLLGVPGAHVFSIGLAAVWYGPIDFELAKCQAQAILKTNRLNPRGVYTTLRINVLPVPSSSRFLKRAFRARGAPTFAATRVFFLSLFDSDPCFAVFCRIRFFVIFRKSQKQNVRVRGFAVWGLGGGFSRSSYKTRISVVICVRAGPLVCQKWSLAPAACMFSKTCIFNTNAEHAICRRVLHSFGVPFKVKMDVSSRRYAHVEKGSFRSALVNTRNSVVFCSVFGAFWVSGCPLGGSISGPKVPPEGHRQAGQLAQSWRKQALQKHAFFTYETRFGRFGWPSGGPFRTPSGEGPDRNSRRRSVRKASRRCRPRLA